MIVGTGFIDYFCLHEPLLRGRNQNVASRLMQPWLLKVNFPSQKLKQSFAHVQEYVHTVSTHLFVHRPPFWHGVESQLFWLV